MSQPDLRQSLHERAPGAAIVGWRTLLLLASLCAANLLVARPAGASRSAADRARPAAALVYAAIGRELREYELDPASDTLSERATVNLPQDIQAGCVTPSGRYVYVAWSDGTNKSAGSRHGLSAFRIDPVTRRLLPDGEAVPLGSRPIYISTDRAAHHVLIAYTKPSGVTVHRIAPDGTPGPAIPQEKLHVGFYAHQVLVASDNRMAIVVSRGNLRTASQAEDPGALDVFSYEDGLLKARAVIAPNGGLGFHPRSVDLDARRRWIFVSLSEQNELGVYELQDGSGRQGALLFEKNSLADPHHLHPGQLTGTVHVHPSGDFAYLVNRVLDAAPIDGLSGSAGGENDVAVFRINRKTGEPVLIQNVDARGMVPGEFAFDPSGGILLLSNMKYAHIRDGNTLKAVPPSLVLFRIRADGKLDFLRKYTVISGEDTLSWMGVAPLP